VKTKTINVRLEDDLTKRLDRLAKVMDRPRSWVVTRAIEEFVAGQDWQIEDIQAAIGEADTGDFASPSEVKAVFNKWTGES
jgi:RHH-type rel operon transcriptional repressor/antitoxin RelB